VVGKVGNQINPRLNYDFNEEGNSNVELEMTAQHVDLSPCKNEALSIS
jgi:hypothetical protein